MNKSFLPILIGLVFFSLSSNAQEYSFGVKGGINYGMGPEIVGKSSSSTYSTATYTPDSEIGFHGGVFFQLKFGKFFVRPEAMYNTQTTTFSFLNIESEYYIEKLSVPLLLGYNIWGPIDIYAGPAYQNIISTTFDNTLSTIVAQSTPLAAHAGVKVNYGRFELDLRYDRLLGAESVYEIDVDGDSDPGMNNGVNKADFDSALHQVMLSLSFKIGDSESNPGRRRGRGCYF